jgi:enolase-phosphatase E1
VKLAVDPSVRVILLDIEGTATPVDFVYKKLFPYASSKLDSFLREHFHEPGSQSLIRDLQAQHEIDAHQAFCPPRWDNSSEQALLNSAVAYCQWLMARDSKCTPLKSLQGRIWQQGYEREELHGEVYADVAPAMQRWRRQGREIYIYSSGSVLAQQLLFRNTASGDLTQYISGFFDTHVGAKSEAQSYRKIAAATGRASAEFLFISDAEKEVEAARSAEMHAILCNRNAVSRGDEGEAQQQRGAAQRAAAQPGQQHGGTSALGIIHSFDEVFS